MRIGTRTMVGAMALLCSTAGLQAQTADSGLELAFMPRTMTVTLLNDGGKYVAIDLKHIPQGGSCRMDEGATIVKTGQGTTPGTTRARYVAPQVSSGGCPFLTEFEIVDGVYGEARQTFVAQKEEAYRKIDELKRELGKQWDAIVGKEKS